MPLRAPSPTLKTGGCEGHLSRSSHRVSFLMEYKLKLICTEEEVALMPLKDGSALRARLVDRGCHNFIRKRMGRVIKATENHRIAWLVDGGCHKFMS